MKPFRKFIPFAKVEEQKDGTLYVYGLVTAEKPDQENEVCDYESTKPFYQKLVARYAKATAAVEGMEQSIAPLREMHQLKAVGCGKAIDFDDDAKTIRMGFHVVESEACKKVKAGVLIGFSQGGDYVKQWPKGKLTYYTADPGEVSLVDSPCLEEALIQQLVEKTFTYVQENGSTELRKFQVKKPAASDPPARDGSLTRAEKIGRVGKAHELVAGAMQKSLYDVKSVADVLAQLKSTCSWLYDEKAWEGDESEVPDKLKAILTQLATVFIELATEEANELVEAAKAVKGATKTMKPELLKKLKELGKGTVSLTADEMKELGGLAEKVDGLEKAGKSVVAHLQTMHKMAQDHHDAMHKAHTDHMEAMHECIGKCAKALGTSESGAGEITGGGEKTSTVTFSKAELDAAIAKALKDAEKTPIVPPPAGGGAETFTKAQLDAAVQEALEKRSADKTKLILVGRDGKKVEAQNATAPAEGEELSKSVGF